jgi:hypothetical protein
VYAIFSGEGVDFGVVELTIVVTLDGRKRQVKLCMSLHSKRGEKV